MIKFAEESLKTTMANKHILFKSLFFLSLPLVLSSLNSCVPMYVPSLHDSLARLDIDSTKKNIEDGDDVNKLYPNGQSPLIVLLLHLDKTRESRDQKFGFKVYSNEYPAEIRTKILSLSMLLIEKGADVNFYDKLSGESVFSLVLKMGLSELLEPMFASGLKMDQAYQDVSYPLINLCTRKSYPSRRAEMARVLIDRGADVNSLDRFGDSVLMIASSNNLIEVCKILIDRGANIDFKNKCRASALTEAIHNENYELSNILIDNGADIHLLSADYHIFLGDGIPSSITINGKTVEAKTTFTGGCNPEKEVFTNASIDTKLLEDINRGVSTLMLVIESQENKHSEAEQLMKRLLKQGVSLDMIDIKGQNALMYAAYKGTLSQLNVLVDANGELYHKDIYDKTAVDYCEYRSENEIENCKKIIGVISEDSIRKDVEDFGGCEIEFTGDIDKDSSEVLEKNNFNCYTTILDKYYNAESSDKELSVMISLNQKYHGLPNWMIFGGYGKFAPNSKEVFYVGKEQNTKGYKIISNENGPPFVFALYGNLFVYVSGKGKVENEDGEVIELPTDEIVAALDMIVKKDNK